MKKNMVKGKIIYAFDTIDYNFGVKRISYDYVTHVLLGVLAHDAIVAIHHLIFIAI